MYSRAKIQSASASGTRQRSPGQRINATNTSAAAAPAAATPHSVDAMAAEIAAPA
jgi:hypothetical protein